VLPLVVAAYLVSSGASGLLKVAVDRARPIDHPLVERPTDVLAGAALGLLVATALRRLPEALRRSRQGPQSG
jgi:hypothetical protein